MATNHSENDNARSRCDARRLLHQTGNQSRPLQCEQLLNAFPHDAVEVEAIGIHRRFLIIPRKSDAAFHIPRGTGQRERVGGRPPCAGRDHARSTRCRAALKTGRAQAGSAAERKRTIIAERQRPRDAPRRAARS